ncbi:MAG: ribosome-associated translation inhibitor RaiA [Kiritimatiellae bacterium]|nr:ribosome-associated translation inhibitor RaiA [Kiritimatiellia bacterium]
MSIEVTVRHDDIVKSTQEYVKARAEEIMAEFTRVEHVHVTLNKEHRQFIVHLFAQAKNHIRVEADAEDDNINTAIEGAIDKLSRQLRKLRDKVQDHKVVMKHVESHRGEEVETEA